MNYKSKVRKLTVHKNDGKGRTRDYALGINNYGLPTLKRGRKLWMMNYSLIYKKVFTRKALSASPIVKTKAKFSLIPLGLEYGRSVLQPMNHLPVQWRVINYSV